MGQDKELNITNEDFYDAIISIYDSAFYDKVKNFQVNLLLKEDTDPLLLKDFLELCESLIQEFNVNIEFNITDNAGLIN